MNTRINDFGNGYIEEILAPQVLMDWDVLANTGSATFFMQKACVLNSDLRALTAAGQLAYKINPAAPQNFTVSLPGLRVADVDGVPVVTLADLEIMAILKAVFDQTHNRVFAANPQVDNEPAPDPVP